MPQNGIVKTFRSSTSGNVPPAGARQTGELWVNMADGQLGYIDATLTAQKLLGVRNYSQLANYQTGDFIVYSGQLYRAIANTTAGPFNAANWAPVGGSVAVGDSPPAGPTQGALWFDSVGAQLYAFYNGQWVIAVNQGGAYLSTAGGNVTGIINGVSPPDGDNSNALATTAWVNANGHQNRNRLINGQFRINQRVYVSGTALAAGTYGHDRWKAGASGCTYAFTASGAGATISITAGSLQQIIEAANIEGGTYTLSWTGTAQGRVNAGAYGASPLTVTGLPVATAATVEFQGGTIALAQLELGVQATSFDWRPFGEELALCQRYYYVGNFSGSGNLSTAGGWWGWSWLSPVSMRVTPTTGVATTTTTNMTNVAMTPLSLMAINISGTSIAAGNVALAGAYNASAEL